MITPLAAAKAYGAAQSEALKGVGGAAGGPEAAQGAGFADLVRNAINDVTQTSKAAETQIAAQVAGKAELIDVVTAISAAEASLETVMAVRDQVIAAYQEIMRMPI
ncbi:MAG TPA: flagellar hook-basal body complex protein FliE [Phenylobacterium sp.]|jgi:flagellar hook-basal body complex protein FliE|nr:flagellar hook-basal body complex protein FliE [Phenylobacterium sp.]HEX2561971.1 flagellar hook-basal body complex protein FliE [Phenylobacterium sp.]